MSNCAIVLGAGREFRNSLNMSIFSHQIHKFQAKLETVDIVFVVQILMRKHHPDLTESSF